ncbi:hybrid sensor histidine kinase/response regulator [Magnetofaba australis]|uniref:Sensory/regulatory protein RpfC n=1 Tax=Magnetofaba australis IT-1 TaxID=1434232 RepID=A0A1Y2JZ86_9PROT|nr:response regulator [Magnetofaba australis]OSM00208.1 putative two component system sensor histidine kinase, barA-like protein [Magnetofaba australis IT-1]
MNVAQLSLNRITVIALLVTVSIVGALATGLTLIALNVSFSHHAQQMQRGLVSDFTKSLRDAVAVRRAILQDLAANPQWAADLQSKETAQPQIEARLAQTRLVGKQAPMILFDAAGAPRATVDTEPWWITPAQLAAALRDPLPLVWRETNALNEHGPSLWALAPIRQQGVTLGALATQLPLAKLPAIRRLQADPQVSGVILMHGERTLLRVGIMQGEPSIKHHMRKLGLTAQFYLDWSSLREERAKLLGRFLLLGALAMAALGWLLHRLGRHYLVEPLQLLEQRAARLGAADINTAPLPELPGRELNALAQTLERMGHKIAQSHAELERQVSERTAALRARETEARKLAMVARHTDNIVIITGPDRRIEWVNESFTRITGYTLDQARGVTPGALLQGPETDPKTIRMLSAKLNARESCEAEILNYRSSGEAYWVHMFIQPIFDDFGHLENYIALGLEITQRIAHERALQEAALAIEHNEQRLRMALENGELGLWDVNFATGESYGNDIERRIYGHDITEAWGKRRNWVEQLHPADRNRVLEAGEAYRSGAIEKYDLEYRILTHDGEPRWVHSRGAAVARAESGRVTRMVGTVRDITERKALEAEMTAAREAAESASEAKSRFLANMSHEIRTPMNAVIGMAELALSTDLNPRQRDYVEKIHASGKALLGILNDILDYSKIEAQRIELEQIPFSLWELLERCGDLLAPLLRQKPVELLFNVPPNAPDAWIGDPLRLGQILNNLLGNALKFTDRGEIELSVRVRPDPQQISQRLLQISVRDTGIGMSQEQMATLFQPFVQADSSATRRFGGSGLGLTISQRLAALMGGRISVSSQPEIGSRFTLEISLPLNEEYAPSADPWSRLAGVTVMVVDDHPLMRQLLSEQLRAHQVTVVEADSGARALAILHERMAANAPRIPCLLLDWRMPAMDGLETARRIAQEIPLAQRPRVVMVTSNIDPHLRQQAETVGVTAMLGKPASPEKLAQRIQQAIDGDAPDKALRAVAPKQSRSGAGDVLRGARALLAEDNPINQQLAYELLTGMGLDVRLADNGEQAVALLRDNPNAFDIVLLDLQMPVMDGLDAARAMRKLPGGVDLPILAMTANAMQRDREACLEAGMDDHLAKPIDTQKLAQSLSHWLRAKRPAAAPTAPAAAAFRVVDGDAATRPTPTQLPGLAIAEAARRMDDNLALYLRMLPAFVSEIGEAPDAIARAWEQQQQDEATRIAHTLKGLAANIGAQKVAEAAVALENALINGPQEVIEAALQQARADIAVMSASAATLFDN